MTHPCFQTEQIGTSDPDPDPRQHYEVHCGKCHWWGYERQLRKIYSPNPLELGGVTPELCCPLCCEAEWLEFKEDNTIRIALLNANRKRSELLVALIKVGKEAEKHNARYYNKRD